MLLHRKRSATASRRAGLLAAAAMIALALACPAAAQEGVEMRGLPGDEELSGIFARARENRRAEQEETEAEAQQQIYRAAGPGALPDRGPLPLPAESIFEDGGGDAADDLRGPIVPRAYTPSTARARAEAARREAEARPASAAERRQAEARAREAGVDPQAAGRERVEEADALDRETVAAVGRDNERARPIEQQTLAPAENPYAPIGMRAGRFVVTGTLEQGLTATDNADYSPAGGEAVLSETTLRLNADSDWSRHSASISAYASQRESISGVALSETRGGIDAGFRLELADGWGASAAGGYEIGPESATSPIDFTGTASQPVRQKLTASLGIAKDVGKLRLGLTGEVERLVYSDADLSGGGTLSQADRDATLVTGALRLGYAVSPALTPFIELETGRRVYDLAVDSAGYRRSADRHAARAGLAFDLSEKFSGELSAGYVRENFDDPRLVPVEGPSLAAAIDWSPVRGTIVRFAGDTTVEGTTTAADSGSILYAGSLAVERQMRANLTGTASLGFGWRDYAGTGDSENYLTAEAGLTWWLNRHAGLSGRLRHERFRSSLAGRDYDISSAFLGLKFQR